MSLIFVVALGGVPAGGCGKSSSGAKTDGGGGIAVGTGDAGPGSAGAGGAGMGGAGARDAGSGTGGASAADAGGDTGAAANLGKACAAATDCGPGLQCLRATDMVLAGTGGPANGYCTIPCTADATCTPLGSLCVNFALNATDPPQAYCFQTCTYGSTDRASKCHGRADVGCFLDQTSGASACLPTCSQDSDCPTGRRCDPQTNVCVDTPAAGAAVGAHCVADQTTGTSNCAGVCVTLGSAAAPTASICSTRCVLGELSGCNWVGQGVALTPGVHGVCGLGDAAGRAGDIGFCTLECDTVNDCADKTDPGAICDMSDPNVVAAVGHGLCGFTAPAGTDAGAAADAPRGN
jgi:hypothetical protein